MSHVLTRSFSALLTASLLWFALPGAAQAQRGLNPESDTLTQSVLIHPPVDASGDRLTLKTREHTYRSQLRLGDQLARDFMVARVGDDGIPRTYRPGTDGEQNEDWFGWRRDVRAPLQGTVVRTAAPDTVNAPGTMNRDAQPGLIIFRDKREDITVVYAHVREIAVNEGETVQAGDVVAKVGNNGNSRAPHVHVGAWRGGMDLVGSRTGGTPLQLQIDLYAEERSPTQAGRPAQGGE